MIIEKVEATNEATNKSGFEATVDIAEDGLTAKLSLTFLSDDSEITVEDLLKTLAENNVVYGIRDDLINEICNNGISVIDVIVATGIEPEHGQDATIDYFFTEKRKPFPKTTDENESGFLKNLDTLKLYQKETY